MGDMFREGKSYEAADAGLSPITVLKRTQKTILVQNDRGTTWRMRLHTDSEGNEYVSDSSVPAPWRANYTYRAVFEVRDRK